MFLFYMQIYINIINAFIDCSANNQVDQLRIAKPVSKYKRSKQKVDHHNEEKQAQKCPC